MSVSSRLIACQAAQARAEDRLTRLRASISMEEEVYLMVGLRRLQREEELLRNALAFEQIFTEVEDELVLC